jgi:hypothetical protein
MLRLEGAAEAQRIPAVHLRCGEDFRHSLELTGVQSDKSESEKSDNFASRASCVVRR